MSANTFTKIKDIQFRKWLDKDFQNYIMNWFENNGYIVLDHDCKRPNDTEGAEFDVLVSTSYDGLQRWISFIDFDHSLDELPEEGDVSPIVQITLEDESFAEITRDKVSKGGSASCLLKDKYSSDDTIDDMLELIAKDDEKLCKIYDGERKEFFKESKKGKNTKNIRENGLSPVSQAVEDLDDLATELGHANSGNDYSNSVGVIELGLEKVIGKLDAATTTEEINREIKRLDAIADDLASEGFEDYAEQIWDIIAPLRQDNVEESKKSNKKAIREDLFTDDKFPMTVSLETVKPTVTSYPELSATEFMEKVVDTKDAFEYGEGREAFYAWDEPEDPANDGAKPTRTYRVLAFPTEESYESYFEDSIGTKSKVIDAVENKLFHESRKSSRKAIREETLDNAFPYDFLLDGDCEGFVRYLNDYLPSGVYASLKEPAYGYEKVPGFLIEVDDTQAPEDDINKTFEIAISGLDSDTEEFHITIIFKPHRKANTKHIWINDETTWEELGEELDKAIWRK